MDVRDRNVYSIGLRTVLSLNDCGLVVPTSYRT